jgi:hypothetical protein
MGRGLAKVSVSGKKTILFSVDRLNNVVYINGILYGGKHMVQIIEIQEAYGTDFYVYRGETLVRVCPSLGMAREVAAGL